jgi:hypothetical protein
MARRSVVMLGLVGTTTLGQIRIDATIERSSGSSAAINMTTNILGNLELPLTRLLPRALSRAEARRQ